MAQLKWQVRWMASSSRHPYRVLFMTIILISLLGYGARFTQVSSDYRYFFGPDNPQRQAFDKLQNVYSQDDSVLFTVAPKDGVVFKQETLQALLYLTEYAWQLPFSTRVDSVTNFQHSYAQQDALVVKDLVSTHEIESLGNLSDYQALEKIALGEPLLLNRLLNKDASVTGVNVRMNFPGESPLEVPHAAKAARDLAAQFQARFPNHDVYLTGMVMMNDAFNAAGINDMLTLIPAMYVLIAVLMYILLRSLSAVLAIQLVMVLSIISGIGFAGWLGIPITPPSSIAPIVIMTLAIANCIHIFRSLFKVMGDGIDKHSALLESLTINLRPIFLTTLTTVVGFLSLNFSDTPPFHDLGNITAAGVSVAMILSIFTLPALIHLLPVSLRKSSTSRDAWIKSYSAWLSRHQKVIFLLTVFIVVFLGMQISRIKVNDQFVGYFDNSMDFRPASEFTIKNLSGIYYLHYDLSSGESQGATHPEYLEKVQAFSEYMRGVEGVVHVSNIVDIFKRLNMNMHNDDFQFYRIPDNKELAAQYLLLYEMSLPYGLDLNSQINVDKSSSRVVITLDNIPTSRILQIASRGDNWLKANAPSYMHGTASSPTMMFSHITQRNINAMLWGTAIALVLITVIMIVALGSVRYGLLSLFPNVFPAVAAIGIWSILIGEAGFSIAFVASVTLGIIVDDTVHILSKYTYARKTKSLGVDHSIQYALQHVGEALISTSIILVLGFSVLMLSGFKLNFVLGALSALTIALALIIDFTFLPVVLRMADRLNAGEVLKMKTVTASILVVMAAISTSSFVNAAELEGSQNGSGLLNNKGLWVAQQIEKRDSGFINQTSHTEMILSNRENQTSQRVMRIKTLEVTGDGDKSLIVFDTPKDVRGTAFLSYSHALTADDQWLYLPALRRVKRINASNKSGPFMGSEFAYEDISSQEVAKYTYRYRASEYVSGMPGHVIERYPVDRNSGYAKQVVWVDEEHWRIHKIDYFDRKSELLKTLTYHEYKIYPNKKWRAGKMRMINHQNGKKTVLTWKDIKFNQSEISQSTFSTTALKRVR